MLRFIIRDIFSSSLFWGKNVTRDVCIFTPFLTNLVGFPSTSHHRHLCRTASSPKCCSCYAPEQLHTRIWALPSPTSISPHTPKTDYSPLGLLNMWCRPLLIPFSRWHHFSHVVWRVWSWWWSRGWRSACSRVSPEHRSASHQRQRGEQRGETGHNRGRARLSSQAPVSGGSARAAAHRRQPRPVRLHPEVCWRGEGERWGATSQSSHFHAPLYFGYLVIVHTSLVHITET